MDDKASAALPHMSSSLSNHSGVQWIDSRPTRAIQHAPIHICNENADVPRAGSQLHHPLPALRGKKTQAGRIRAVCERNHDRRKHGEERKCEERNYEHRHDDE
jgi:hypothetical protein